MKNRNRPLRTIMITRGARGGAYGVIFEAVARIMLHEPVSAAQALRRICAEWLKIRGHEHAEEP